MVNPSHLNILMQGVGTWNNWRLKNPDIEPNLKWADLEGKNLSEINFNKVNLKFTRLKETILRGANLRQARLDNAYLRRADLTDADLTEAGFAGANLRRATLTNAKLIGAFLRRVDLSWADLRGVDFSEAILEYARLVDVNIEGSILAGCSIYGISAWNLIGTPKEQSNLIITRRPVYDEPPAPIVTVDDLEVAQFINLLLNHHRLRMVINSVTEKGVLILGRFGGGGLDVLQSIATKLKDMGYLPIIFDFDRPTDRTYTETVKTLVGLSRFVIVDLSGPSVPQELCATVPHFQIPFAPIIEKGRKTPAMLVDFSMYPWYLNPPVEFSSLEHLIKLLPSKIVAPAEEKHKERQKLLQQIFVPT